MATALLLTTTRWTVDHVTRCMAATLLTLVWLFWPGGPAHAVDVSASGFATSVAISNSFKIQTSKLAVDKARSSEVRGFAEQIVREHTAADEKFKGAISQTTLQGPSSTLDDKHQGLYESLFKLSGDSFDKAYIELQFKVHEETVELFEAYAASGEDPALKSFAQETLPTLRTNLQHISKLWKSGPP